MPRTILLTGFGPFPGSPFNPTEPLVARLARLRRPALADIEIVPHVFPTSYAAVDRELPALLDKHDPDAVLMFGLAGGAARLRIETRARNAILGMPDAAGSSPASRAIALGAGAALAIPAPTHRLLAAVRKAHVPAALSRDAGKYLCNYLCWRAAQSVYGGNGPRLAAFVHVPMVRRDAIPRRRNRRRRLSIDDLARAGSALLTAVAAAIR